ncbi:MetQ/NlpA family ABC transporter substrate-binding protein [Candidatus Odyssella acanthamoebae]|uniref:Dioxygenase n=1 Tax=Candidatus Odyssella acanthamoebae TaxID=91604 RepID=A0A077AW15_9PROT|nr:MetQ/NlpA family ABC transporter substrate-binding protein [Candidatus Paracaedibacter acanthamoebae]AIK95848.1 dioxygenase [Candidatus Paracaedibacter acanthamoebae]
MKKFTLMVLLSVTNAFAFKLGVTAGPHAIIAEEVVTIAKKDGLKIEVIEFSDFILPNIALNQGDLDANSYQHQPFLDNQIKDRGFKLTSVGKTVLMPLGIYSKRIKNLNEVKEGATIGIPNDPTNGGRALLLLEKAGLITLKKKDLPSVFDISENSKKLNIKELDAPLLPRSLDDLDLAVINTDWVILAKLNPKSALISESIESPYTNVIAVRIADQENDDVKKLVKAYQSQEIKDFIHSKFAGAILGAN